MEYCLCFQYSQFYWWCWFKFSTKQ